MHTVVTDVLTAPSDRAAGAIRTNFNRIEPISPGRLKNASREGASMLRTILMIAIVVWIVDLGLHFGGRVLPLLLVVAAMVLVMNHMFRRRSFN
jgi:hypothetical protein